MTQIQKIIASVLLAGVGFVTPTFAAVTDPVPVSAQQLSDIQSACASADACTSTISGIVSTLQGQGFELDAILGTLTAEIAAIADAGVPEALRAALANALLALSNIASANGLTALAGIIGQIASNVGQGLASGIETAFASGTGQNPLAPDFGASDN